MCRLLVLGAFASLLLAEGAAAFCGFYVAKADTKIFNRASQVVLARDGDRTVVTMVNDYQGDPKEFAMVVPVPTFLEKDQIHVGDPAVVAHLDAYTSPRLVEYFDPDPCVPRVQFQMRALPRGAIALELADAQTKALGVSVEASYTVGEYDILILSAEESQGLETWLRRNGYRIPEGASRVLGSYLRQGMRFFVAKVNLEEQARLGFAKLRPLQVAYESPKFMLPIRLGTVNAQGPQELFVYTLTRKGRVETTNYRTLKLPSGSELPVHVKASFGDFYRAMFSEQTRREQGAVFLEYAWDMAWCDPCAADPLSPDELRELGAFWVEPVAQARRFARPQARDVFVTRLHVRYDAASFPEDLVFQETGDRGNFQARYVLRHAWAGGRQCDAAERYEEALSARWEREAQTLASLTGWDIERIRAELPAPPDGVGPLPAHTRWWQRIWSQR